MATPFFAPIRLYGDMWYVLANQWFLLQAGGGEGVGGQGGVGVLWGARDSSQAQSSSIEWVLLKYQEEEIIFLLGFLLRW